MKKLKLIIACLLVAVALPLALPAAATSGDYFPTDFENTNLEQDTGLIEIIANLINIFMGALGVIAVILMLYGGFVWMTAQGDDEKVTQAKGIIKTAVIGIIVIFAAWALASFAIGYIAESAVSGV